jgi:hypothetical protein
MAENPNQRLTCRALASHRPMRACACGIVLFVMVTIANGQPGGGPVLPRMNCSAPLQPQGLALTLIAETVAVQGRSALHWHINPLPTGADIQVSDPALQKTIQEWVDQQNSLPADPKNAWILDGAGSRTLLKGGLDAALEKSFTIQVRHAAIPPPAAGTTGTFKPTVSFCAAPVKTSRLTNLEIAITADKYDAAHPTSAVAIPVDLGAGIKATALISQQDRQDMKGTLQAYAGLAGIAWGAAKKAGIAMSSDVSVAAMDQVRTAIGEAYHSADIHLPGDFASSWPQLSGIFQCFGDGRCELVIEHAQIADGVTIKVASNLGQSGATQRRAENIAARTQDLLLRRFAASAAAIKNTVPTFAQLDALRSKIATAPEIYPDIQIELAKESTRTIVFAANNRFTTLRVNLTAGGGYSAEDSGTGSLNFTGENLILSIPDAPDNRFPKETENLSYTGGGQVQRAAGNWGVNWTRGDVGFAQNTFGPQISTDYLQDQNQRFGNTSGPVLRDHEIGWEPSFAYAFTSAQVDTANNPLTNLFGISASGGVRQRWVRISPATGDVFPPLAHGSTMALFADVTPGYHYQPVKPGNVGEVDVSAAFHVIRGLPAGDFVFTQVQASVQATLYFGGTQHPRDYFVRFRKGIGTSNGATPLFELFRLGGTDNTRGVEQGEQVGRQIAFEQSEAGVSARQIVSWFQRKPTAALVDPPAAQPPSPIDLNRIYLTGFYDRGRVFSNPGSSSFSDLMIFNHGAKGYGLLVALAGLSVGNRRITLGIGYARSPDSRQHSKGLPITSATIDF